MEMKMLRWSVGVTQLDRVRTEQIRGIFKIRLIEKILSETRLRGIDRQVMKTPEEPITRQVLSINTGAKTRDIFTKLECSRPEIRPRREDPEPW